MKSDDDEREAEIRRRWPSYDEAALLRLLDHTRVLLSGAQADLARRAGGDAMTELAPPPLSPSAEDRLISTVGIFKSPNGAVKALRQAHRAGVQAERERIIAALRDPTESLTEHNASGIWKIDAGWSGLWQEASQSSKDDYRACSKASLAALADWLERGELR